MIPCSCSGPGHRFALPTVRISVFSHALVTRSLTSCQPHIATSKLQASVYDILPENGTRAWGPQDKMEYKEKQRGSGLGGGGGGGGGGGRGRGCTKKLKPNGSLPKTGTLRGGEGGGGGDEAARRISSLAVHYRATPSKRGLHTYTPKREHPANDKRGPAVQSSAERVHRNTNRVSSHTHTQRAETRGDHHSQRYNIHLSNQTFCMKTLN